MTHLRVLKDLRVFVKRRRIDGDSVSLSDEELLPPSGHKVCVLRDVANHEDAARQARRLLYEAVCKQTQRTGYHHVRSNFKTRDPAEQRPHAVDLPADFTPVRNYNYFNVCLHMHVTLRSKLYFCPTSPSLLLSCSLPSCRYVFPSLSPFSFLFAPHYSASFPILPFFSYPSLNFITLFPLLIPFPSLSLSFPSFSFLPASPSFPWMSLQWCEVNR